MKKLLSLLTTLSISTSTVLTVVSCSPMNYSKSNIILGLHFAKEYSPYDFVLELQNTNFKDLIEIQKGSVSRPTKSRFLKDPGVWVGEELDSVYNAKIARFFQETNSIDLYANPLFKYSFYFSALPHTQTINISFVKKYIDTGQEIIMYSGAASTKLADLSEGNVGSITSKFPSDNNGTKELNSFLMELNTDPKLEINGEGIITSKGTTEKGIALNSNDAVSFKRKIVELDKMPDRDFNSNTPNYNVIYLSWKSNNSLIDISVFKTDVNDKDKQTLLNIGSLSTKIASEKARLLNLAKQDGDKSSINDFVQFLKQIKSTKDNNDIGLEMDWNTLSSTLGGSNKGILQTNDGFVFKGTANKQDNVELKGASFNNPLFRIKIPNLLSEPDKKDRDFVEDFLRLFEETKTNPILKEVTDKLILPDTEWEKQNQYRIYIYAEDKKKSVSIQIRRLNASKVEEIVYYTSFSGISTNILPIYDTSVKYAAGGDFNSIVTNTRNIGTTLDISDDKKKQEVFQKFITYRDKSVPINPGEKWMTCVAKDAELVNLGRIDKDTGIPNEDILNQEDNEAIYDVTNNYFTQDWTTIRPYSNLKASPIVRGENPNITPSNAKDLIKVNFDLSKLISFFNASGKQESDGSELIKISDWGDEGIKNKFTQSDKGDLDFLPKDFLGSDSQLAKPDNSPNLFVVVSGKKGSQEGENATARIYVNFVLVNLRKGGFGFADQIQSVYNKKKDIVSSKSLGVRLVMGGYIDIPKIDITKMDGKCGFK